MQLSSRVDAPLWNLLQNVLFLLRSAVIQLVYATQIVDCFIHAHEGALPHTRPRPLLARPNLRQTLGANTSGAHERNSRWIRPDKIGHELKFLTKVLWGFQNANKKGLILQKRKT